MDVALRDLLIWVDHAPRTYAEAMEAWGSHCPRFTTWEDALDGDLIHIANARVQLTRLGVAALSEVNGHYRR
jgi:hypothetical protein